MKESELTKQYSDKIMAIVNNIRLLGDEFNDRRTVEKVIITLLKNKEGKASKRSTLKEAFKPKTKKARALQAMKKRRAGKRRKRRVGETVERRKIHYALIARKLITLEMYYWFRPDIQSQAADGNQAQEEYLFTTSCFISSSKVNKHWLIDSGCTNHMAPDESMFKKIDKSCTLIVKIGIGQFIEAKGKCDVLISSPIDTKVISDVFLVPELDHNLLTIGQLLEKKYYVIFKDR
ncbi:pleiotropic drug resistance protein 3-like [Gossypium australe]|uniref:Pleiotropic drug resistance protein 3-like n=1 Tax=Gossypium australe TaxID=47621 RepID=A0A5B6X0M0_9ROSI|nr:pleiotropic drug resistance protein 3-like [Gossypium australe]